MDNLHSSRETPLQCKIADYPLDDSFRNQWLELWGKSPYHSPFNRLEWIEIGIELYGNTKPVLPFRFFDQSGLLVSIGIFHLVEEPGRLGKHKVIRTIDYNSQRILPVLAKDSATMAKAMHSLYLQYPHSIDYFDFYKLDPLGDDLNDLQKHLKSIPLSFSCSIFNEQPQFLLNLPWDAYLEERTQGHRKRIRRYTRKLQEEYSDYQFFRFRTNEEFEAYGIETLLSEIMQLFCSGWQGETLSHNGKAIKLLTTFYRRVALEFIPLGLMDICLLKGDNHLLAFELNICDKDVVYMMFGSYDREYAEWSPGNAIFSEIIQDSLLRGYKRIEFGGEYLEYKKLWTKDFTCSYQLRMYGTSAQATVKKWIHQIKNHIKK